MSILAQLSGSSAFGIQPVLQAARHTQLNCATHSLQMAGQDAATAVVHAANMLTFAALGGVDLTQLQEVSISVFKRIRHNRLDINRDMVIHEAASSSNVYSNNEKRAAAAVSLTNQGEAQVGALVADRVHLAVSLHHQHLGSTQLNHLQEQAQHTSEAP